MANLEDNSKYQGVQTLINVAKKCKTCNDMYNFDIACQTAVRPATGSLFLEKGLYALAAKHFIKYQLESCMEALTSNAEGALDFVADSTNDILDLAKAAKLNLQPIKSRVRYIRNLARQTMGEN